MQYVTRLTAQLAVAGFPERATLPDNPAESNQQEYLGPSVTNSFSLFSQFIAY